MAYGKWNLTTEEEKYFIPLFKYMIDELECGRRDEFNLSGKGITPWQAKAVMEELGYVFDHFDINGWEQDTWFYFENTDIVLFSSGMHFELRLFKQY
jgi:hypothetical protein